VKVNSAYAKPQYFETNEVVEIATSQVGEMSIDKRIDLWFAVQ
jgi:hypothetical protein